jgi:hypothetical protein
MSTSLPTCSTMAYDHQWIVLDSVVDHNRSWAVVVGKQAIQ